mmetsp:Transcript_31358/g.91857  ORF Transcript_31358/g.91857 Transcript_31358/m.91857 type:complete len:244 (-) Transcript_31358:458-1189(-)
MSNPMTSHEAARTASTASDGWLKRRSWYWDWNSGADDADAAVVLLLDVVLLAPATAATDDSGGDVVRGRSGRVIAAPCCTCAEAGPPWPPSRRFRWPIPWLPLGGADAADRAGLPTLPPPGAGAAAAAAAAAFLFLFKTAAAAPETEAFFLLDSPPPMRSCDSCSRDVVFLILPPLPLPLPLPCSSDESSELGVSVTSKLAVSARGSVTILPMASFVPSRQAVANDMARSANACACANSLMIL